MALAWLSSKAGVTSPIVGVTKPHHLGDALASLEVELTEDEVAELESGYQPRTVAGHR